MDDAAAIWNIAMDNLAWHYNPVVASDVFIRANLAEHGMPGRYEQLWAKREDERTFRVCCIPFFTYGIALGDTVETDEDFTLQRIVSKAGHKTLRIAVANRANQGPLHSTLQEWAEQSGASFEWYSEGYLAVDIPPGGDDQMDLSVPTELERSGEISMELDG